MTFEDGEEMTGQPVDNQMDIGCALRKALLAAKEDGRLTFGVYKSGKLLEMNPDGVMLCILPENVSEDVTLQIHFTLIQAYCWENDIRLIKVDSGQKLCKLLSSAVAGRPHNDNDRQSLLDDYNCILVEYPATDSSSEAEEDVMEFCKMTCDVTPQPIVQLEV